MLRRIAVAAGLALALALVGVPCWIAANRADLPAPGDGDLAVRRTALEPGSNAFDHLRAAAELIDWRDANADARVQALRAGEAGDAQWVESLASRNRAALEELGRAVAAPVLQFPLTPADPHRELGETLTAVERLVRLAGLLARLRSDGEAAWLGLEIGHQLAGGEGGGLLALSFASALQRLSVRDLEVTLRQRPLTAARSRAFAARLDSLRWSSADWARAWAAEYQWSKAYFLAIPRDRRAGEPSDSLGGAIVWGLIPADYLWQPNRTLALVASDYRARQRTSALACIDAYLAAPVRGDATELKLRILTAPNPIGRIRFEVARTDLRSDFLRCHTETRLSLLQVLAAAQAYASRRGQLPEKLAALAPEYLEALPRDGFTGTELRYSAARKLAYSIGQDFVDAEGGASPDPSDAAEPAISLALDPGLGAAERGAAAQPEPPLAHPSRSMRPVRRPIGEPSATKAELGGAERAGANAAP